MLIPLTRKTFEELVPVTATADQYRYYWGKPADVLRRVLLSVTGVVIIALLGWLLPNFDLLFLPLGVAIGFYWLWSPIWLASQRNRRFRSYRYSGFWQGEVMDVFVSEDLIGTEETVNRRGELVIVENRERRLNLEVGDDTGFYTKLQVPLKRDHRAVRPGDRAEMIVMGNRSDLSLINKTSDIFLSDYDLWVSDYPYLQRNAFLELSRRLDSPRRGRFNADRDMR